MHQTIKATENSILDLQNSKKQKADTKSNNKKKIPIDSSIFSGIQFPKFNLHLLSNKDEDIIEDFNNFLKETLKLNYFIYSTELAKILE